MPCPVCACAGPCPDWCTVPHGCSIRSQGLFQKGGYHTPAGCCCVTFLLPGPSLHPAHGEEEDSINK